MHTDPYTTIRNVGLENRSEYIQLPGFSIFHIKQERPFASRIIIRCYFGRIVFYYRNFAGWINNTNDFLLSTVSILFGFIGVKQLLLPTYFENQTLLESVLILYFVFFILMVIKFALGKLSEALTDIPIQSKKGIQIFKQNKKPIKHRYKYQQNIYLERKGLSLSHKKRKHKE